MRLTYVIVVALVLLLCCCNGCSQAKDVVSQLGIGQSADRADAGGAVELNSGGDAVNLSPSIAITGSSLLGALALILLLKDHRRTQKTLTSMIRAVEGCGDGAVKTQISRQALSDGVSDYLHCVVKRVEKN